MDLSNILSQLGVGSRQTVYLSVTPGIGLELIELDFASRTVKNYSFRPLEYNEALREISDFDAFKNALTELLEEFKLNPKNTSIVLNIPMVFFANKELPLLLGDDAITEALTSEVEQSYIFRRSEPVISWTEAIGTSSNNDTRRLLFTAVQQNILDGIKAVFDELGLSLAGVEMSLTSVLKALAFSGNADDVMKDNVIWNLMLVNQNGYSITSLSGKKIVDYYEEPLPIRSLENDEIYNAINASAQITLMNYPASYLFIVSETNLVSAEILSSRVQVDGTVKYLENNQFKKQNIIPVSLEILEDMAGKISLEAIGIATGNMVNMPVKFNFIATGGASEDDINEIVPVKIGDKVIELTPLSARNVAMAIAAVVLIPLIALNIFMPIVQKHKQQALDDLNARIQTVEAEINKLNSEQNKLNNFDVNSEIKKVLKNNRIKLMSYSALGDSVPKNLWITYFVAKDDGKIDIKGESKNVENVYRFFRNMRDSIVDTKLMLYKLELETGSVDEAVEASGSVNYGFEITNISKSELEPKPENEKSEGDNAQQQQENNQPQEENKSGGDMFNGKPLLNLGNK